jgi:hypothetical protein
MMCRDVDAPGQAAEAVSWLLDTDVICQPAKKNGDAKVVAWLEALQAWLTRLVDALHGRIHGLNVSVAFKELRRERPGSRRRP